MSRAASQCTKWSLRQSSVAHHYQSSFQYIVVNVKMKFMLDHTTTQAREPTCWNLTTHFPCGDRKRFTTEYSTRDKALRFKNETQHSIQKPLTKYTNRELSDILLHLMARESATDSNYLSKFSLKTTEKYPSSDGMRNFRLLLENVYSIIRKKKKCGVLYRCFIDCII